MKQGFTKSAVIGIDIGTCSSIIGYVGKSMVDIAQNEVSQRKTPSVVGFTNKERTLGDAAHTTMKSNWKNTVRNFKHLIGPASMCKEQLEKEKLYSLATIVEEMPNGSVGCKVNYKGEEIDISFEQIYAMYLTKMREVAQNWCQAKITDIVVSCPSYFNDAQRQAIRDAAEVSGLFCLKVMNEHLATALAYGIYRTNDFDKEKPLNVAFGHMGHSGLSVSVVSFIQGNLQVLCESHSNNTGGREMIRVLMQHFGGEFQAKYGCNPLKNKKAMLKLEDACGRCKKILSANEEAPINIECLLEDEDLMSKITRTKFEELCEPQMKITKEVVDDAIAKSGLSAEDIHFVEIIGGASRVPWFQRVMSEEFNKDLSRTLNQEECIAKGCALQAAMLSPLYKVRDFSCSDKTGHEFSVTMLEGGVETKFPMLNKEDRLLVKQIGLERNGPFTAFAGYTNGVGNELGEYLITMPQSEEMKKVRLETRVNVHGMFEIKQAVLEEKVEYQEVTKEKKVKETEEEEEEWVEVTVTKVRNVNTVLEMSKKNVVGYNVAEIQRLKDFETGLQTDNRECRENDNARNSLESYVYNMREKLCEPSGVCYPYLTQEVREEFGKGLKETEVWLYDCVEAKTLELVERLQGLEKIGNPVLLREQRRRRMGEKLPAIRSMIAQVRTKLQNPSPLFAHIAYEKKQQVICEADQLEQQIFQQQGLENAKPLHEDVNFDVESFENLAQQLTVKCNTVLAEPKPVEKEKETEDGDVVMEDPPKEDDAMDID